MENENVEEKAESPSTGLLVIVFFIVIMGGIILVGAFDLADIFGGSDSVEVRYSTLGSGVVQIEWESAVNVQRLELEAEGEGSFVNTKKEANISELGGRVLYTGSEGDVITIWAIDSSGDRELVETYEVSG